MRQMFRNTTTINEEAKIEFGDVQRKYFYCTWGFFPEDRPQEAEMDMDEQRKARNKAKQKEKREEKKQIKISKTSIEHQSMINKNRHAFGIEKNKLQSKMDCFFT